MTARNQILSWAAIFFGFFAFVYLFKSILTPFVLGVAIAYLLNPLVLWLGKLKITRGPATLVILGGFFLFVLVFLAVLLPVLSRQAIELASSMPGYVQALIDQFTPYLHKIGLSETPDFRAILAENKEAAANLVRRVLNGFAAGGSALLGLLSLVVLTPIVAYFTMVEWDHMTKTVEDLLPRDHKKTIKDLLSQIDTKISGFVRGQITVAAILGILYAVALSLAGLNYGLVIGLVAGLLSVIPMLGSVLGLLISIVVAWFQAGELSYVALIAGIFLAGQLIEGNVLSPKIIGDSVGLHPIWIFFALMAGGALFGILGMLLAVPVAAVAGVLLAFSLTQYKASKLYKGKAKKAKKKA